MSEFVFFATIGSILGTVLLIFGMKYFSAARQAQSRLLAEDAYRKLAEKAVAAQSENTGVLAALQADVGAIKLRLAAVEQILKEVG